MKKRISLMISLLLVVAMMAGCTSNKPAAETPKTEEPAGVEEPAAEEPTAEEVETPEVSGALKTGLGIVTSISGSKDAASDADGLAQVYSTVAAVTVDENGVITDCKLDAAQNNINFSAEGKLVTPLDTVFQTKNELGEAYGMKGRSGIGKEWDEQAAAFAQYVIGKTSAEVSGIAMSEGYPADEDLLASVTVHITDFIGAVEKAAANAVALGAQPGDKLGLAISTNMSKSTDASAEKEGLAQAYSTYVVTTVAGDGKITSCVIDASQGNVNFDTAGKITTALDTVVQTKNELGEGYGMKDASGIGKEWNEQAEAFAAYVTGKTADEVKGIAMSEGYPADEDLLASVTVHITDFVDNVAKAVANAK